MTGRSVAVALVVASILWPAVLAAALLDHVDGAPRVTSVLTYLAAGRVCHQRQERSFLTRSVQWPVCGRCTGLYGAAPFGAAAAFGRRRRLARRRVIALLGIAALPTVATVILEWVTPSSMTSLWRMFAALPLGAALALVVVSTARGDLQANRVH